MPDTIAAVSPVVAGRRYMTSSNRVVDIIRTAQPDGIATGYMYPSGGIGDTSRAERYDWRVSSGAFASGNDGVPHQHDLVQCLGDTPQQPAEGGIRYL